MSEPTSIHVVIGEKRKQWIESKRREHRRLTQDTKTMRSLICELIDAEMLRDVGKEWRFKR